MREKQTKKTMKKKDNQSGPQVVEITSGDQLKQELAAAKLFAEFGFMGKWYKMPVEPMSPKTAEAVRELRRKALPPPVKNPAIGQPAYNELDPNYLKNRDENEKKARSLMIYSHCPVISAMKSGLTATDQIHDFVQGLYTETILEIISLTIQSGGITTSLEERVDFTSAGTLES